MVVMLYRSNILALVGSENNPIYNKNKVIIWDDYQKKTLSELKFSQNILNLKLRKDKIAVICTDKIYLFSLNSFQSIDIIETGENPHGVIGINYSLEKTIIAYPDKKKGKIKIKNYEKTNNINVNAHEKTIGIIVLTINGDLMASATEMGTIIRIFDTDNGNMVQEVRRGKEKAQIKCICFEQNNKFIAATSNRGTVHIWSLSTALKNFKKEIKDIETEKPLNEELRAKTENEETKSIENKRSIFNVLPNFLGGEFFNSEWSFAQVRIKEQKSICTFGSDNTIIIVCSNGKYYKAKIPIENGGECEIIQEENILEKNE
jgi:WD40 repeat protein